MRYRLGEADVAPLPRSYSAEPRYLKYQTADAAQPYAQYFRATTRPVQPHVVDALVSGMAPTQFGYGVDEVADRMARPGYDGLETGWTRCGSGLVMVSVLTFMPGVTARMWDWWVGWHGRESGRYKLWHPDAHQYSALAEDRSGDRSLTDRQRYVGNVCYVDEYVGGRLLPLAVRFLDPSAMGIADDPGSTHICARVTLSNLPLAFGWLVHQVRPTDDGVEMRSRFFLNDPELLRLPAGSLPHGAAARVLSSSAGRLVGGAVLHPRLTAPLLPDSVGPDMVHHCAAEMNHLAAFLPEIYEEFRGTP